MNDTNTLILLLSLTWLIIGAVSSGLLFGLAEAFSDITLGSFTKVFVVGSACGFITYIALLTVIFIIFVVNVDLFMKKTTTKLTQGKITKRR
jgi:hypothetical protein